MCVRAQNVKALERKKKEKAIIIKFKKNSSVTNAKGTPKRRRVDIR